MIDDDDDDKAMWRRNRVGGSVTQRRLNVVAGLLHWLMVEGGLVINVEEDYVSNDDDEDKAMWRKRMLVMMK